MNDVIYEVVAETVRRQPWYQKNANTIVAGLGALVSILSFLVTLSLGLPEVVVAGIGALISILTTLGIKLTRNGVQPGMAAKLALADDPILEAERERSGYIGRHRAG